VGPGRGEDRDPEGPRGQDHLHDAGQWPLRHVPGLREGCRLRREQGEVGHRGRRRHGADAHQQADRRRAVLRLAPAAHRGARRRRGGHQPVRAEITGAAVLLITDGQVLAAGEAPPAPADVLVDGDRIVAVGPGLAAPPDATRLDAAGKLVVPGLINAHTHAHNNLIKGVADSVTLELFLNTGPAMYLGRTHEEQYLSALLGAVEMVKTGCTSAYDLFMALPSPSIESVEAVVRA